LGFNPKSGPLPDLQVKELINFFRSLYKKSVLTSQIIDLASLQESRTFSSATFREVSSSVSL